jgi:hypothetical protein
MTIRLAVFLLIIGLPCATPSVLFAQQEIRPPLHTSGYDILDAAGHRVRISRKFGEVETYGLLTPDLRALARRNS